MTTLEKLNIHCMRNIEHCQLALDPKANIISGVNGSGKSTLIEALHLIGLGQSFRSRYNKHLIEFEQEKLTLFTHGKDQEQVEYNIGIEKHINNDTIIQINGDKNTSRSQLAQLLPMQLIHPQSFELLSGSPDTRRQFLDWGVFHHKKEFGATWQQMRRLIKQRNAMLKTHQANEKT